MRLPGQCLLWVHPADEVEPVVGRPGSMSFWIPTGLRKGGPQAAWKSALGVHHFSLQGLCLGLHLSKIPLSWLSLDQAKAPLAAAPHLQPEGLGCSALPRQILAGQFITFPLPSTPGQH